MVNVASVSTPITVAVMILGGGAFLKGVFLIVTPLKAIKSPKLSDTMLRLTDMGFVSGGLIFLALFYYEISAV
ncbi:MAG: hypothetical protein V7750_06440 [Sneathiella sp.]